MQPLGNEDTIVLVCCPLAEQVPQLEYVQEVQVTGVVVVVVVVPPLVPPPPPLGVQLAPAPLPCMVYPEAQVAAPQLEL